MSFFFLFIFCLLDLIGYDSEKVNKVGERKGDTINKVHG